MDDQRIGLAVRALRHRRGWRQSDLATRADVSRDVVSALEHGRLDGLTLGTVRGVATALGARAALDIHWGGRGDIHRLLDADHAWLQQAWARRHADAGWDVWPEASFSQYGERGLIDLLAFHAPTRVLTVTEVKTGIWDVQELLGSLDVKVRNAGRLAAMRAWRALRVVPALVVLDGRTARRRIHDHATLFGRFELRGASATAWIRRPNRPAGGILIFVRMPNAGQGRLRQAGRRRVRVGQPRLSVDTPRTRPSSGCDRA